MARRPYWQGHIRLALVSIPVEIYTATRSDYGFSFHMIHAPSGKRVHYDKVVDGVGEVPADEIMKGYEYEKGRYVLLEPDELDAVRLESRKTLELKQFVDLASIDPARFERPYHVLPADDLAQEAYSVIRDALTKTGKAGIGQLSMRGREDIVALMASGRGLILETLRYDEELVDAQTLFKSLPREAPSEELVEMAVSIIEKRSADLDLSTFDDRYEDAVRDLVTRKMRAKGRKITVDDVTPEPVASNVVDLMAAFKKSLTTDSAGKSKTAPQKRRTGSKAR